MNLVEHDLFQKPVTTFRDHAQTEKPMAIYELDGQAPELPADGRYWIAETAVVIGRVRLKQDASVWWGSVLRGDRRTAPSGTMSCCMAAPSRRAA
jgi:hypothetical protein